MVYLNSKNIKLTQLFKMLDYKYYRSYKIKLPIEKQAYCLRLPLSIKIYNIFHVNLLKLCNIQSESTLLLPPSIIVNKGEKKYEIEKILDSQLYYSKF